MLQKITLGFTNSFLACLILFFAMVELHQLTGLDTTKGIALAGSASVAMASFSILLLGAQLIKSKPQLQ